MVREQDESQTRRRSRTELQSTKYSSTTQPHKAMLPRKPCLLGSIACLSVAAGGGAMVIYAWVPLVPRLSSRRPSSCCRSVAVAAPFSTLLLTSTSILSQSKSDVTPQQGDQQAALPTIVSPVLQQCYHDMLDYNTTYGHPDIPLPAGRPLVTLRRLYSQNKLAASDIELLNDLKFTWNSLEDVYTENVDRFSDFLQRLLRYADAHNGDPSPPKKYPPDPELGAWVTGIRRLRTVPDAVDPAHVRALDAVGFAWTSPRQQQCGSQFMVRYRDIQQRCVGGGVDDENGNTKDALSAVWRDPAVVAWIRAQQHKATELSSTRQHYMAQLLPTDPGESWLEWEPPAAEKE